MVQQAMKIGDIGVIDYPVAVEYKYDGMRVLVDTINRKAYSRTMKELPALSELAALVSEWIAWLEAVSDIEGLRDIRWVDGEYGREWKRAVHARQNEVIPVEELEPYYVFDLPDLKTTYMNRRYILERMIGDYKVEVPLGIKLSYMQVVESPIELEWVYKQALKAGYEGVMVKRLDSPYRWGKRHKDWLKYKPVETLDVVAVGFIEGTGRLKGSLGAIEVRYKPESGNEILFKVGMGFSDEDRREVWGNRDLYKGKMLEVKVQWGWEVLGKPRHSVFLRWRWDLEK